MMKLERYHLWLALAFLGALFAAFLSRGHLPPAPPGAAPTAGLGGYAADSFTLLGVLVTVGLLAGGALLLRESRGGADEAGLDGVTPINPEPSRAPRSTGQRAPAGEWERALHEVTAALLGGIRLDPQRATREALEVIDRLKTRAKEANALTRDNERLELQIAELEQELEAQESRHRQALEAAAGSSLTNVLEALLSYEGTTVRGLIDHLQARGIQVPMSAKEAREGRGSLLKQALEILPSPTAPQNPKTAVHREMNAPMNDEPAHERPHERPMNGQGGGS